jgi:hypothetical protein
MPRPKTFTEYVMTKEWERERAAEPDYRAELAEFRAQVRYALDEWVPPGDEAYQRLRALVGPWPHEEQTMEEIMRENAEYEEQP